MIAPSSLPPKPTNDDVTRAYIADGFDPALALIYMKVWTGQAEVLGESD